MSDTLTHGSKLCHVIASTPDVTNATARIAAWVVGVADITGGFPIELSYRQVTDGFTKDGVVVAGTGSRTETIKVAFEWLEARGYLKIEEGSAIGFGHSSHLYTLSL